MRAVSTFKFNYRKHDVMGDGLWMPLCELINARSDQNCVSIIYGVVSHVPTTDEIYNVIEMMAARLCIVATHFMRPCTRLEPFVTIMTYRPWAYRLMSVSDRVTDVTCCYVTYTSGGICPDRRQALLTDTIGRVTIRLQK